MEKSRHREVKCLAQGHTAWIWTLQFDLVSTLYNCPPMYVDLLPLFMSSIANSSTSKEAGSENIGRKYLLLSILRIKCLDCYRDQNFPLFFCSDVCSSKTVVSLRCIGKWFLVFCFVFLKWDTKMYIKIKWYQIWYLTELYSSVSLGDLEIEGGVMGQDMPSTLPKGSHSWIWIHCRYLLLWSKNQLSPEDRQAPETDGPSLRCPRCGAGDPWVSPFQCLDYLQLPTFWGYPGGSDSKESVCNAEDLSSSPLSGRSLGEGNGNPL